MDSQTIHRSGNYSASQNSSDSSNRTASQDSWGSFYTGAYTIRTATTAVQVNPSGSVVGSAQIAVSCHYGGTARARVDYPLELGLWDRTTGRWIAHSTRAIRSFGFTVSCAVPFKHLATSKNLSVAWSLGLNPSPAGVNLTDLLEIVTIFHLHSATGASWGGCRAYAFASISVMTQRMQGYHY